MKKLAIILVVVALAGTTANADLLLVDATNSVYKTTTGEQTLYWYLNLGASFNKTYDEQVVIANGLTLSILGVPDEWHLATPSELPESLGQPMDNTQVTLVANTLASLGYSTGATGKYTGRYEDVATSGYYATGHHKIGQLGGVMPMPPTVFTPNIGVSYALDTASQGDLAAWIVTVPEPATMSLLAIGGLAALLRRRSRKA